MIDGLIIVYMLSMASIDDDDGDLVMTMELRLINYVVTQDRADRRQLM